MRRTLITFFFFLWGVSEVCMGQYSIISSRRNSLIEQIQSLNLQIKKENNQSEKKMLTIRRDTLQKKLDYINQAIEKQNIRSTPHFVGEETSQEENKAPGSAVSTGKSQPSTNDLDRFKRTVTNYINQGNSITAYNYIKKTFEDSYPSDPNEQFAFAALLQDIIIGLTNDGTKAAYSMDFSTALVTTSCLSGAHQMQTSLYAKAASNGHEGAMLMLQVQLGLSGGGVNTNPPINNSSNKTPSTTQKTCTLCNGKGWIAGSKTPTYGNSDTHWCNECSRNVNASHSHDRCPSCSGRGYRQLNGS